MTELKLFDVDLDGCVSYWVAATSPEECKALVRAVDCEEPVDYWDIKQVSLDDVRGKLIHDPDTKDPSGKTPLADLFWQQARPGIIACSEW